MGSNGAAAALLLLACWMVSPEVVRVIDGDTFVATVEIWPKITVLETIRVLGVDTPEMHGPQRDLALLAKGFSEHWLAARAHVLTVTACGRDDFGRLLGRVGSSTESQTLDAALIQAGLGKPR